MKHCRKYHPQLFKKNTSSQCMACRNGDEQHDQRHRNIAELIRKLRELDSEDDTSASKTPTAPRFTAPFNSSVSKKDRKEAKKAAKAAERPRVVTAKDLKQMGHILHPSDEDATEDLDFEKQLLEDDAIDENKYYHRGTSNTREMRHRFIRQERAGKVELHITEEEMQRIMAELKVPRLEEAASRSERAAITAIRKAVEEDLVHCHGEDQQTMMRKAGFWRWASRKAYERLVANGRIWDWKNEEDPIPDVDEQVVEAAVAINAPNAASDDSDEDSEPTPSLAGSISTQTSKSGPASTAGPSRNTSIPSASRFTRASVDSNMGNDDGWTSVGKLKSTPGIAAPSNFNLKLKTNNGLAHLTVKASPKTPTLSTPHAARGAFAMLSTADEFDEADYLYEDEEDDDVGYALSPLASRGGARERIATPVVQMRRLQMTPRM